VEYAVGRKFGLERINTFTAKILSEEGETLHFVIFYILLLGQDLISSAAYPQTP
jgi:hypothetical protein